MAIITISRQFGSGGDEIAARLCERLGYRYFDKAMLAQLIKEVALSEVQLDDFSEDDYRVQGLLERLFGLRTPRPVAQIRTWMEGPGGMRVEQVQELNEEQVIPLIRSTILAAHRQGNVVIVGRGGQIVLQERLDVLHVRIEAPLENRLHRLQIRAGLSPSVAYEQILQRDRAAESYLRRFYNVDWADPLLYHLVLNTGKVDLDSAVRILMEAAATLVPMG